MERIKKNLQVLIFLGFVAFLGSGTAYSNERGNAKKGMAFPFELTEGANAIIRDHQTHFRVISAGKGVRKVQYSITILNKKAAEQARLVVYYDKLNKVKSIDGKAFDASGKQIAKIRKSDIKDHSNFESYSIFEDNRLKTAVFSVHTYPYTVWWEYEIETTHMMFYPLWMPLASKALPSMLLTLFSLS